MVDYLVSTAWLKHALSDSGATSGSIKIVEATFFLPTMGRDASAEFLESHLPDAVLFDIEAVSNPESHLPHMLPSPALFALEMGKLGLKNTDHIILYDRSPLFSAARAWWMFRYYGHQNISILDGGYAGWLAEGGATESGMPTVQPADFIATAQSDFTSVSMDEMVSWIEAGTCPQIIDARASDRFLGLAKEPRAGLRSGHIPGALNVPISSLLDPETGKVKPKDTLKQIFDAAGVAYDRPAITSCGSGITACGLIFALAITGKTDISLYDGSWSEWGASDHPIAP